MRKLLSVIVSLVALALAGVTAGAKSEDFSVMSFNIHGQEKDEAGDFSWEARKKGCLKAIKKYDPDVLFLQEAYAYHKADIMKEMKKHMLVDRSSKPGTVDPEISFNENPIMFRADKFELLDYGSFWLNEKQEADTPGWDASKVRNTIWVKLRYKKSGVIFFCFNTHFSGGELAGKGSATLMVDKIKEIAGDDAVVFVGGDFKMSSSDRILTPLASYAKDANYEMKKPDTRASYNGFGKPGNSQRWPDHILSRNAKVEEYEVVDGKFGPKYISDHYPIYAEFEIPIPKGK
ncbi:MAG: endonuclease/exonuclease/phosphatase family protein [Bacteroidales bacterium]|nr:endonuclease/exonuclease/phosphatase family protein [Bacteroidales bacterium]